MILLGFSLAFLRKSRRNHIKIFVESSSRFYQKKSFQDGCYNVMLFDKMLLGLLMKFPQNSRRSPIRILICRNISRFSPKPFQDSFRNLHMILVLKTRQNSLRTLVEILFLFSLKSSCKNSHQDSRVNHIRILIKALSKFSSTGMISTELIMKIVDQTQNFLLMKSDKLSHNIMMHVCQNHDLNLGNNKLDMWY